MKYYPRRICIVFQLLPLIFLAQGVIQGQTSVSGTTSGTWTRSESPYLVTSDVTVPEGMTLTIEPGVTVQFRDTDDDLRIDGSLFAVGTASAPITFTSDNSEKAPGQWGAIELRSSSVDTEITHALIEYGGGFRSAQLTITGSSPHIEAVHLRGSRSAGLAIDGGSAEITSSQLTNNGDYAAMVSSTSSPVFAGLSASGNGGNSIGLSGGTISESVTWSFPGIPYTVIRDITVAPDSTLTITPGSVIQFQDADDDLRIDGALIAVGTASTPITFTSATTEKTPGQWGEILIRDSSDDSLTHLEHCVIEYGGGFRSSQLSVENASPLLRALTLRSGRTDGLGVAGGNPVMDNIHFANNGGACANFDVHAFPEISGSSASGNGTDALVRHGGTLTSSGTWMRDQIPYTIISDIIVAAEARLTIEPGTTVQFRDADDDLRIEGTLIAKSVAGNQITFTSDNSEKAPGQWGAIELRSSSVDTEITHALIEYGGGFRSAQLTITGSSPHIEAVHLRGSRSAGLAINGGSAEITSSQLTNNGDYAAMVSTTSSPVFADLSASGNGGNSIGLSGGTISESVTWSLPGIPYTVINDITVAPGSTLTITPGSVIQFQNADDDLKIEGTLIARGVRGGAIRFTSSLIDKNPGQWGNVSIQANDAQVRTELSRCIFEYGGGFRSEMLLIQDSNPLIESCTFQSGRARGLTLLNSNAEIKNNSFVGNNSYAAEIDLSSFPNVAGNEASENGSDSIGVMGGTLAKNGVWHAANLPFTIISDVTVEAPNELTITPGSIVQFQDADDDLVIEGNLVAVGNAAAPIRFTSDAAEKAPGQWGSIAVRGHLESSSTAFHFCHFDSGGGFRNEILLLDQRSPEISHSTFSGSRDRGLTLQGSLSSIHDCLFVDNRGYAAGMNLASFPSWGNNRAEGNDGNSIAIFGGTQSISGTWNISQIPYTIINDVTIAESVTLSIHPGTTVQFQDADDDLLIAGSLRASGTQGSPLLFTSDAANKVPGQWGSLTFQATSNAQNSLLSWAIFESGGGFASGMVELLESSPAIENCEFRESRTHGLYLDTASPSIEASNFHDNQDYGIRTVGGATPVVRNSSFVDNQDGGITNSDTSVVVDAINNYWGAANGPLDTRDADELGQLNPEGQGQAVSEYVRWLPFLTEPNVPEPKPLPALEISPSEIVFGEVVVGETASGSIRLQNTGQVTLTLSDITIDTPEFSTDFLSPQTLEPNDSVELSVTFSPSEANPINGRLTLSVPALGVPSQLIRLVGTGVAAPVDPQDPPTTSSPLRITFDSHDELSPTWHPTDNRIAFATNRTPGEFNDLGMVNSDGSNERLIATGPQTGFGLAPFGMTWAGPTDFLVTSESVTFHEYLSFDTTQEPFNRTVSDNDDEAFSRLLLIDGGGGGELFKVSRDGSTALWRFSSQGGRGDMSIRSAPFTSLAGQSAQEHGTIHIAESLPLDSPRLVQGAGLFSDGSQFVAAIRSGNGYDLFLYSTAANSEPIRLTQEGESLAQNHTSPTISPDNQWVAFVQSRPGEPSDIYLRNLENGETRNLTKSPKLSENLPSWSPDGTQLVYQRFDTTDSGALQPDELPNWNLYVINTDAASSPSSNGGVACESVPAGQLAWWTGDNTPTSETGSDPLTPENGADYAEGFINQAFIFDGIGSRISTGLDAQPSALPTTTWEAWVRPTRVGHGTRQQILSTDDGGFDRSVLIEAGTSNFGVFTGTGVWYPTSVTVDEWQHIAVVFTPETILFYKNGEPFNYGQAPSGQGTRFDLKIGYNPGFGEYFQGSLDDVAIYNRQLTPSEIQGIVDAGAAGKCASGSRPPVEPSGPSPKIQPSEASIAFPATEVGTRTTEPVTLSNTGNASLIIDRVDSTPPFAGLLPSFPLEIAPSESAEMVAIFAPTTFGEFTGTLALRTNDPNSPIVTFNVAGTGIELVVPPPILSNILPTQAFPGDEIALTGTGFREGQDGNSIRIGDLILLPTGATNGEIRFSLPAEISAGVYTVSVATDGRESNPLSLTILPPVPIVRPELTITRVASGTISASWNDPSNSFHLQINSNLGDADGWTEASPITTSAPGSFVYEESSLEGQGFFRLAPRR